MKVIDVKNKLVNELSQCETIKAIGQTGDINAKLIPGNSDIDLFVLCNSVPTEDDRKQIYLKYLVEYSECQMNVCNGGIWGYGDILIIDGIDVMFMYFTVKEMSDYLEEVLQGRHLDKVGGFYPTGRLSSIENINILYERDEVLTSMKNRVKEYSVDLFKKLYDYHINRVLDEEDLGRVILRNEVIFYHQVLENSLDHLLQALYALNVTYFPSRKRVEQYIDKFNNKPVDCNTRLHRIISNSVSSETIEESVRELRSIVSDIKKLSFMM